MSSPHNADGGGAVLTAVADLVEIAGRTGATTVAVAGGDRTEDLRLVESARDHGIVDRILLIGRPAGIRRAVEEVGIYIPPDDIVPAGTEDQIAAATVKLIRAGGVDVLLKGNIPTPTLNRHMLALAVRPTVSLATVFDAGPIARGRPMVLTDAGVTTVCHFGRMVGLIRNAVDVAHAVLHLDRPRVAILSANEKQVASLPSTAMGLALAERPWPDAVVDGPLSFDLATDPASVAIKGLPDRPNAAEVAGRADVLVCPGIDAANCLYKMLAALSKYGDASLASITVGFPVPYVILSRADSLATRLESVALCSVYAHRTSRQAAAEATAEPTAPPTTPAGPFRVLVVNPGSTSMKAAVFENDRRLHSVETPCDVLVTATPAQRRRQVRELARLALGLLEDSGETVDAVAARGGFLPRPDEKLPAGTYLLAERRAGRAVVDETMVRAILDHPEKPHASNLGIPVAAILARRLNVPAFVVDPVVVDEFAPEAEVSGYAPIVRRSTSHALNVRAAARAAAEAIGRDVESIDLVVAHLGGGITVAAVRAGRMIDNNIALLGGGPFTPQRAGQLPLDELIDLCYSRRFTRAELVEELTKRGGLRSYLDEDRLDAIEQRIERGDAAARRVVEAMVYQIAKEIGAAFVAVGGRAEAIVLTGGLARSRRICTALRRRVGELAPVVVLPGSLESAALAAGAVAVLSGRQKPRRYRPPRRLKELDDVPGE